MKPVWISGAILAIAVTLLLMGARHLEGLVKPLEAQLNQAESLARSGEWASAHQLTKEVETRLAAESLFLHVTLPHAELDQISLLLAQATAFLAEENLGEYRASNQSLIHRLSLLYGMETLSLENLF